MQDLRSARALQPSAARRGQPPERASCPAPGPPCQPPADAAPADATATSLTGDRRNMTRLGQILTLPDFIHCAGLHLGCGQPSQQLCNASASQDALQRCCAVEQKEVATARRPCSQFLWQRMQQLHRKLHPSTTHARDKVMLCSALSAIRNLSQQKQTSAERSLYLAAATSFAAAACSAARSRAVAAVPAAVSRAVAACSAAACGRPVSCTFCATTLQTHTHATPSGHLNTQSSAFCWQLSVLRVVCMLTNGRKAFGR